MDVLDGCWSSGINKERSNFLDFPTTWDNFFGRKNSPFPPFLGFFSLNGRGRARLCAHRPCSNGLRIDGSGDSDQAGVEIGDQGHGWGLWFYHWVYGHRV
jgi:hypothetical protein